MKNRKFWVSLVAGIMAAIMLLGMLASIIPTQVNAASSSEIRQQIKALEAQEEEIQERIDELNGKLSDNLSDMEALVQQKEILDQQVFLLHSQINNTSEQISAYAVLIADKQDELTAAQNHHAQLNEQNRERIRAMEEDGSLSYWSVLFKANNFSDLLDRLNMVEEIAASDQRRLQELREAAEAVATAMAELETEKSNLEETKEELAAAQLELEEKDAEATAILDELRQKGEEFEALMAEAEEEQADLAQQLAVKEEELEEAEYREYMATYVPPPTYSSGTTTPSVQAPSSSGWVRPVPYYTLTSPFGYRVHPIYGDWRMHNGIDMACSSGTPIYAAKSGKVIAASYNGSMGYYVQIDHGGGFRSIYMHMTHYIVGYGQQVNAGQVIGYVGSTGASTGPHLHFGITYNGSYVNPLSYIPR